MKALQAAMETMDKHWKNTGNAMDKTLETDWENIGKNIGFHLGYRSTDRVRRSHADHTVSARNQVAPHS